MIGIGIHLVVGNADVVPALSSYDSDAVTFFEAAGITDSTQKSATDKLTTDFKAMSLWSKMLLIKPVVGGTAAKHKWNLKDPRDLDAAYRSTYVGGLTHSANGILPDGSTGYADTHLAANVLSQNSMHLAFYSRTNVAGFTTSVGAYSAGGSKISSLSCGRASDFTANWANCAVGTSIPSTGVTDTRGLFCITRTAAGAYAFYRNGVLVSSGTDASVAMMAYNYLIFARSEDFGGIGSYSGRQGAFVSIGSGLDATDNANLYTAVQAFQTTLGRQV